MITKKRKPLAVALSVAGVLCLASVVSAQYEDRYTSRTYDQQDEPRMSKRDQRSFERYLEANTQIARQLSRDPELISDREFRRDNESLDEWLDNHADAEEALRANPHKYLGSNRARQSSEERTPAYLSESDLRSFENFLDNNPETARQLYENPDLIKDRQFTRNNTALDGWIDSNPKAAGALQANPHKFLWRERSVGVGDFLQQLLR